MPPSEQCRACRGALRLGAVIGQSDSRPGKLVDTSGGGSAEGTARVARELAKPKIVDLEVQDVRLSSHLDCSLSRGAGHAVGESGSARNAHTNRVSAEASVACAGCRPWGNNRLVGVAVMAVAVVFFLGRLVHHRGLGSDGLQTCAS